jgi:hypothetical protein
LNNAVLFLLDSITGIMVCDFYTDVKNGASLQAHPALTEPGINYSEKNSPLRQAVCSYIRA